MSLPDFCPTEYGGFPTITRISNSSVFANLLPDVLGKFSLLSAFDSFSTDHVFDVPGILLYLSISALLVFLTVQVIQKRRWN